MRFRADKFRAGQLVPGEPGSADDDRLTGDDHPLPGVIELGRADWRDLLVSGGLPHHAWRTKVHHIPCHPDGAHTPSLGSSRRGQSSGRRYADEFEVQRHERDGSTRPCDFSLALGDVAFADFSLDGERRPVLLRISFDGYGCCTPDGWEVARMDAVDSATLLSAIESGEPLGTEAIRSILRRYFETHRTVVWEDALIEWGLVQQLTIGE